MQLYARLFVAWRAVISEGDALKPAGAAYGWRLWHADRGHLAGATKHSPERVYVLLALAEDMTALYRSHIICASREF